MPGKRSTEEFVGHRKKTRLEPDPLEAHEDEVEGDIDFDQGEGDEGDEYNDISFSCASSLTSLLPLSLPSLSSSSFSSTSSSSSSSPSSSSSSSSSLPSSSSSSSLTASQSSPSPACSSGPSVSSLSSPSNVPPSLQDELDEEVCYVVADFKKLPEGGEQLLAQQTTFELSQLHTEHPHLLLGTTHFSGRFVPTVGTHLIFEITERSVSEEKLKKKKVGQKLPDRRQVELVGKSYTQMTFVLDKSMADPT